jgi:hypothetical protein
MGIDNDEFIKLSLLKSFKKINTFSTVSSSIMENGIEALINTMKTRNLFRISSFKSIRLMDGIFSWRR